MPTFREPCSLHQTREQPDTELSPSLLFIYYATCGVEEGKKRMMGGRVGEISPH